MQSASQPRSAFWSFGSGLTLSSLAVLVACGGETPTKPLPDSGTDATARLDLGLDQAPSPDRAGETRSPDALDARTDQGASDTGDLPGAEDARDATTAETSGTSVDLSPETAGEAGHDGSDAADAPACAELSGTSPFGKALAGTATFSPSFGTGAPITRTETVYIYFPGGRVAGAPVQLALQSGVVPTQYFFGPPATLASDLSATGLTVAGHDTSITADLLARTGGLQATVSANFASPSTDVGDPRTAAMRMCPSDDVPTPALRISAAMLGPLSTLALNSTTPLAADALQALRIASPLGAVAFRVSTETNSRYAAGPNFTIAAASAFPPGQPLTFDTTAVKDVLGRSVPAIVVDTPVLATTAVLSDLTLAAAPPAGAIAGSDCTRSDFQGVDGGAAAGSGMVKCTGGGAVAQGMLTVNAGGFSRTGSAVDALLALPATTASKLRVRMIVGDVNDSGTSCTSGGGYRAMRSGALAVVGANGESSSPQSLSCDGAMSDHLVDLPTASALWLVVHLEGYAPLPYMSPTPSPPSFSIDELQFM